MAESDEFDQFVVANQRRLLRAAWLLCGDWGTAEDLVQHALLEAWRRWAHVSGTGNPAGYVYVTLLRQHARLKTKTARETAAFTDVRTHDSSAINSPEDAVGSRQLVQELLRTLPTRQRAVLVCRYFLDQTEQETARLLGCRVGTVKSHAARAQKTLRQQLDSFRDNDSGVAHEHR